MSSGLNVTYSCAQQCMDVRPGNLTWNPQNWMFYIGGCLLFQGGIFRSQSLASSPLFWSPRWCCPLSGLNICTVFERRGWVESALSAPNKVFGDSGKLKGASRWKFTQLKKPTKKTKHIGKASKGNKTCLSFHYTILLYWECFIIFLILHAEYDPLS